MTTTGVRIAGLALCLGALGLAGCNDARDKSAAANSGICFNFKQPAAAAAPVVSPDGAAAVDDCTRRWAYSLAPSRDEAVTVADAVIAACAMQLARWNQQTVGQPGGAGEAASILTGQPTTPIEEHYAFTRSRALLYVTQARAGRCSPPPAANGMPEGVR